MMKYLDEVQDAVITEKLRLVMTGIAESIGDNDEAAETRDRTPDPLDYRNGFEFVAPCTLSFYSSSGTGTPLIDKLIEREIDSQAAEWKRQFPNRAGMLDILSGDGEEFRDEAEQWEQAALDDEVIYIRIEAVREHGDIKFSACFMNEVNIPYGDEYEEEMTDEAFLALAGDDLEALGNRLAEAPYKAKLD